MIHARMALLALLGVLALPCAPAVARGVAPSDGGRTVHLVLAGLPADYTAASRQHDARIAARVRTEAAVVAARLRTTGLSAAQRRDVTRLTALVAQTREELEPWPIPAQVAATAARVDAAAGRLLPPTAVPAKPYAAIRSALGDARDQARRRDLAGARLSALGAAALYDDRLAARAQGGASTLDGALWEGTPGHPGVLAALVATGGATATPGAVGHALDQTDALEQSLGDVVISHASVVTDAAILVFREGLEAVLILAAITASFVGAKRHMRRPVLIGGLVGLAASLVTWVVAQTIIHSLSNGGLELEAITGLVAIGVLLLITNWFFHRVYWSQWISRFNKRRRALEQIDKLGFVSGQTVGLVLLGLTSVYREGFETVLFLQNLEVSAGAGATVLGAGIGIGATLVIGATTFLLQRKLPYKKLLIATGMMIALVLAVMVGSTVHVLQGLGWLPTSATSFAVPLWANRWFGLYATWQGLALQLSAFVFVVGSYWLAREVQVKRPSRRRARAKAAAPAAPARVPTTS